jgi:hypothetical protein
MSLRYSRFYLFGDQHYYGHIRLPQQRIVTCALLGSPTFMRYLLSARNPILPRVFSAVLIVVDPSKVTGFVIFDSLANTISVTRLN